MQIQEIILDRLFTALLKLVVKGSGVIAPQGTDAHIYSGYETPEANVTAAPGSVYLRTAGGTSTSFYVKESGSGNTGWVAK